MVVDEVCGFGLGAGGLMPTVSFTFTAGGAGFWAVAGFTCGDAAVDCGCTPGFADSVVT